MSPPVFSPWSGSSANCRPENRKLTFSRGGSALASRPQMSICVTTGPGATRHGFLTGCSSQCTASGPEWPASVATSPFTAITHAATASRAVLAIRSASSRPSRAPTCRIVSATDASTLRAAVCADLTESASLIDTPGHRRPSQLGRYLPVGPHDALWMSAGHSWRQVMPTAGTASAVAGVITMVLLTLSVVLGVGISPAPQAAPAISGRPLDRPSEPVAARGRVPGRSHHGGGSRALRRGRPGVGVRPFVAGTGRAWMGLGAIAADLMIALIVTSLLRRRLGRRRCGRCTGWRTRAGRRRWCTAPPSALTGGPAICVTSPSAACLPSCSRPAGGWPGRCAGRLARRLARRRPQLPR